MSHWHVCLSPSKAFCHIHLCMIMELKSPSFRKGMEGTGDRHWVSRQQRRFRAFTSSVRFI